MLINSSSLGFFGGSDGWAGTHVRLVLVYNVRELIVDDHLFEGDIVFERAMRLSQNPG